jgi:hypothetical protein
MGCSTSLVSLCALRVGLHRGLSFCLGDRTVDEREERAVGLEPARERVAVRAQGSDPIERWIAYDPGDLVEPEAERAVHEHDLELLEVAVRVEAVALGRPTRRNDETDLVPVVQGPHAHAREPGDLTDRASLHGPRGLRPPAA